MKSISRSQAEDLAIQGFQYLGSSPERLRAFLNVSGLEIEGLRQAASGPLFLPAVLDFILSHKDMLFDFVELEKIAPERLAEAHDALARPFNGEAEA